MIGKHILLESPGATVVDAPGDLVVGTGSGTVDRLPVGSVGRHLFADSSAALGESWHLSPFTLIPAVGDYITPPHVSRSAAVPLATDTIHFVPIWIPFTMTFDRISAEVTTLDAASLLRVGIYSSNGTGVTPGSRVLDAGTLACTSVAIVEATISQTLSAGLYWLAAAQQSGGTAQFRMVASGPLVMPSSTASNVTSAALRTCLTQSGVSGAFPATATPVNSNNTRYPLVALRRSA